MGKVVMVRHLSSSLRSYDSYGGGGETLVMASTCIGSPQPSRVVAYFILSWYFWGLCV